MNKNLLRLSAFTFVLGLTGALACSSDPNSGGGCMGGGAATPQVPASCPKGWHDAGDGNGCVKNPESTKEKKGSTTEGTGQTTL